MKIFALLLTFLLSSFATQAQDISKATKWQIDNTNLFIRFVNNKWGDQTPEQNDKLYTSRLSQMLKIAKLKTDLANKDITNDDFNEKKLAVIKKYNLEHIEITGHSITEINLINKEFWKSLAE
ncbi:hypothetical protein [Flammeovirga kamogawensis]|uniref:Uncharacterized protein n=1 Tax=Flammeovirga kamogawensis TaxID=373891 RepID=A0ABX8H1Q9_9BACT|nr:hypothetical protein [Flammeovirga kamogawensis]MBB6463958.1 hypothetical protein [Flammeovirga kamogawensis]QWG09765.1 hypothetical protein KM029_18980 [Flammeovirga kamogawensis]TRX65275.1 hypothetical protein EO216_22390 [Flammeovirga kamogawensis]